MEEKIRLDSELVNRGLIRSRELAKDAVKAGKVTVNGNVVNKPSFDVKASDSILYHGEEEAFVSRGSFADVRGRLRIQRPEAGFRSRGLL